MLHIKPLAQDDERASYLAEKLRLEALDRFDILDTPREDGFDGIARLIRNIFNVPVGIVSVIDAHRQWYKACDGLGMTEAPRGDTICNVTIREARPLVVKDTLADPRFRENPYVAGEPRVRFYAGVPLRSREGQNIGTLCAIDFKPRDFSREQLEIMTDLARVAMAEFELRQLATVDSLTGVLSRRAFKEESARVMALARRHELDMSCVAFDLDHFKAINDKYGHAAGDIVLAGVAGKCAQILRRSDQIGRLGGEEFAVLLPHTDRSGAMDVANKLRAAIEGLSFEIGGETVRVTASFGVATAEADIEDFDVVLAHADACLYEAKAGGRNRCVGTRPAGQGLGHVRRRVLKAGSIRFNHRMSAIDCTVRTLSEEGAGLDISNSVGVPDAFDLLIRGDGMEHACRVTSRTDRHVEVDFA